MNLNLKRPLAFFDLETTGVDVSKDRIVEIAVVKVMPDGSIDTRPKSIEHGRILINPGIPIPQEASMVHGIWDEDVKDAPTFKQYAKGLKEFLKGCDLAGFNSNRFDIPLLAEEFLRVGVDFDVSKRNLVDVQTIFHIMEQRTLSAGYKFYCGKDLDDAHAALPDTMATYEILKAMVERYDQQEVIDARGNKLPNFTNDMEVLSQISTRNRNADLMGRLVYNDDNEVVFNFGKHKGELVKNVLKKNPGYYSWMKEGDFPEYTKRVLDRIKIEMHSEG